MNEFRISPLPHQDAVLKNFKNGFIAVGGAVGSGKTYCGLVAVFLSAMEYPKTTYLIGRATNVETKKFLVQDFSKMFENFILKYNGQSGEMELINGSKIFFQGVWDPEARKSSGVAHLAGLNLSGFFLSQAESIPFECFAELTRRLREKCPIHFGIIDFNPRSKSDWIYKIFFESAKQKEVKVQGYEWKEWHQQEKIAYLFPLKQYPFLPQNFVKRILATDVVEEKQYLQGVFPEVAYGKIYTTCTEKNFVPRKKVNGKKICGIDFGVTVPTACVVIVYDEKEDVFYIVDEYYEKGKTAEENAESIKNLLDTYGEDILIYADPSSFSKDIQSGISTVEIYEKIICRKIEKGENNLNYISTLIDLFNKNKILIFRDLISFQKEIDSYIWKREGQPQKKDDHLMDAMRYAIVSFLKEKEVIKDYEKIKNEIFLSEKLKSFKRKNFFSNDDEDVEEKILVAK